MKTPCHHCEKRHPKCHDTCEAFREFRVRREEANRYLREGETARRYAIENDYKRARRAKAKK
jgi:hypothetical protein